MSKNYYTYITTNSRHTVLYTGVTDKLKERIYEHKHKMVKGFTYRYNVDKLVYYEVFSDINKAIKREKQIKGITREKKIQLIERMNPDWKDLYYSI